jgi:UDP-3-O-[3-hydroxymyristoyl] glucosamine N-acyltransferase
MNPSKDQNDVTIAATARIGSGCDFRRGCIIEEGCTIGNHVIIGHYAIIYPGAIVGDNAVVQDHAVLGKKPRASVSSVRKVAHDLSPLFVGRGSFIGCGAVLYAGTTIGEECFIGDLASLRENCQVGKATIIGRGVMLEHEVKVGDQSSIVTQSFICEKAVVEDKVFIGARVCCASGLRMNFMRDLPGNDQGPTFRYGCRVGTGSMIYPHVMIGREAVVAAGAVVTEDVPDFLVVIGHPARPVKEVPLEERLKA